MTDAERSSSQAYTKPGNPWAAEAAKQGRTGTQRLLAVETGPPPPEVTEALGLQPGENVVTRRRLILADDQPVELADSHYPATIAADTPLQAAKKIKGGAVRVLAELGHPLEEAVEKITARRPSADEAALLGISTDQWLLILTRVSQPRGKPPAELAVNKMVAEYASPLVYRIRNTGP